MLTPVPVPYVATYTGGHGCMVLAYHDNGTTLSALIALVQTGEIKQVALQDIRVDGKKLWAASERVVVR